MRTLSFCVGAGLLLGLLGCTSTRPSDFPNPRPLGNKLPTAHTTSRTATTTPDRSQSPSEPTPRDTLTLPDVLAWALRENPRLQAFAWTVRAREAQAVQAGLYPNPTLSADTEALPTGDPVGGFSGAEQSVRLGIPLEVWGRIGRRRDVADAERDVAGWDYEAARLDVWTQASKAFVGVLAAQERARLAEARVRLSEDVYETVCRQVDAGKVSPVEQTRAQVPLSEARIQRNRARHHLLASQTTLAGTWGRPTSTSFAGVAGAFGPVDDPPPLDAIRAFARRNPQVARQAARVRRAEAQHALEKANRFPVPTVTAGWQRFGETDTRAFAAGVTLPLPLFDRNQGSTQGARYRVKRATQERHDARVRVDTTLTRAYSQLAAAYEEVNTIRDEALPAAQTAFDAIRRGYREGKFGYLDVLDVQRTLFDVRRQEVHALSAYYQHRLDVERLIGTPLSAVSNE